MMAPNQSAAISESSFSLVPLLADDIQWTPFQDGGGRDSLSLTLLGLSDDEIREGYVSLWEDRNAFRAVLQEATTTLAAMTNQRDRLRDQCRQLRDVN